MPRKKRELTKLEMTWLVQNFPDKTFEEVRSHLKIRKETLREVIKACNLKKSAAFEERRRQNIAEKVKAVRRERPWPPKGTAIRNRYNGNGRPPAIDEDGMAWLRENFPTKTNNECAKYLDVHITTVARYAKIEGLSKDPEYMERLNQERMENMWKYRYKSKWPPKGYIVPNRKVFPKGMSIEKMFGKDVAEEAAKKRNETWHATYRAEKMRERLGLPRKTKMKIGKTPDAKVRQRYYLKKRGYIIDEAERIAYFNEGTNRSLGIEKRGSLFYKFAPLAV